MAAKIPDGAVNASEDLPLVECAEMAAAMIEQGATIYQKFTCECCGQRLTMDVPNTFYRTGTCDKCGKTTTIKFCGLLSITGVTV